MNILKVCIVPNKDYTKGVIKYRIFSTENIFKEVTKYQCIKQMTEYQLKLSNLYKWANDLLKGEFKHRLNFNVEISKGKESNSLTREQIEKMEVLHSVKNCSYLEQ